jgi:cyclase
MRSVRVIPALLLKNSGLVKTVKFKEPVYIGDPINAIKIFNEKEVDELVFLDMEITQKGREPDYKLLQEFASEAFFPLAYGGGVSTLDQAKRIFRIGVEKIVLSSAAISNPQLVREISDYSGSSSVVVCIDVKKSLFGAHKIFPRNGQKLENSDPFDMAKAMEDLGAGEIIVNSVDLDGTMAGYDYGLIGKMSEAVSIPVVALGGAGSLGDLKHAVESGASAVAAGSFFVFFGKLKGVLITYPSSSDLDSTFE